MSKARVREKDNRREAGVWRPHLPTYPLGIVPETMEIFYFIFCNQKKKMHTIFPELYLFYTSEVIKSTFLISLFDGGRVHKGKSAESPFES